MTGETLTHLREQLGFSTRQLALYLEIDRDRLGRYEKAARHPVPKIIALAMVTASNNLLALTAEQREKVGERLLADARARNLR